jgi:sphingosine kinase
MSLIIINPVSGKGNSEKIFYDKILPYLDTYNKTAIYITTYREHATKIILNTNFIHISNIILVGGDGLIHEVVQGLIQQKIYDKNIYIVPTGSGNGFAKSLNINNIEDAIKMIINIDTSYNQIQPVDIFKIIYGNKIEYSFLSQTWAMISDIDIGTEWLRYIGDLRFFWGILKFLFINKSIIGKLDYKSDCLPYESIEGKFTLFCASNVPWISSDFKMLPYAMPDDKLIDIIYIVNYTMTFFEKIRLLYNCLQGTHITNCKFVHYVRAHKYILTELETDNTSYILSDGEKIDTKNISVEKTNKELLFVNNRHH